MKHALPALLGLLCLATPALADDALVPATQAVPELRAAFGKDISIEIAPDFAKGKLAATRFDRVVTYGQEGGSICLLAEGQGLEASVPALAGYAAPDGSGAVCLPLSAVSLRLPQHTAAPSWAAPVPLYSIDAGDCTWEWRQGKVLGLWTGTCKYDDRLWTVTHDESKDSIVLSLNGIEHVTALRVFHAPGGPPALFDDLKTRGLVSSDPQCQMTEVTGQPAPDGWTAWQVVPSGKMKEDFEKVAQQEIPEPPCGELGYAVDYVGFFMVNKDHPDYVLFANLGQDGTMIDLASIRFK